MHDIDDGPARQAEALRRWPSSLPSLLSSRRPSRPASPLQHLVARAASDPVMTRRLQQPAFAWAAPEAGGPAAAAATAVAGTAARLMHQESAPESTAWCEAAAQEHTDAVLSPRQQRPPLPARHVSLPSRLPDATQVQRCIPARKLRSLCARNVRQRQRDSKLCRPRTRITQIQGDQFALLLHAVADRQLRDADQYLPASETTHDCCCCG